MVSSGAIDRQNKLLPVIAVFKLLKAAGLLIVAWGFHHLRLAHDPAPELTQWIRDVRIDPGNRIAHGLISRITGLPLSKLHELGVGTFFYGMLFATEGVGLLMRRRWAEYLTVISTSVFLPLEIIELVRPGRRIVKAFLLLFNVAVIIYLVMGIARNRKREALIEVESTDRRTK